MEKISKTQVDRLGDRLKKDAISEADFKILDDYRKSFGQTYEQVVGAIRQKIHLEPTGRPAKSTSSIIEKLHRESIRLSQVQDIAGCRVVVADIEKQDDVIASLREVFSSVVVVDRRIHPSHGYRAVHVIIKISEKLVEVQVRTELQHGWAELSEKFSDTFDPAIKYGGGDERIQKWLCDISNWINGHEEREARALALEKKIINKESKNLREAMTIVRHTITQSKKDITDLINKGIHLTKEKRKP